MFSIFLWVEGISKLDLQKSSEQLFYRGRWWVRG